MEAEDFQRGQWSRTQKRWGDVEGLPLHLLGSRGLSSISALLYLVQQLPELLPCCLEEKPGPPFFPRTTVCIWAGGGGG